MCEPLPGNPMSVKQGAVSEAIKNNSKMAGTLQSACNTLLYLYLT